MPELTTHDFPAKIAVWGLPILLSAWGGLVNFYFRWRHVPRASYHFSAVELIGDVATSAFSGVLFFLIAVSLGCGTDWSAVIAGIGGHMGSRSLFLLERRVLKKLELQPEDGEDEDEDKDVPAPDSDDEPNSKLPLK